MQVLEADLHEASWPIASGDVQLERYMCSGAFQLGPNAMDTLVMTAMSGEDTNMTVDICDTQMVVNLVYANDDRVLGILYQHADICLWCNQFAANL